MSTTTATPGTIEHHDPNQIEVETNIREDITLGREFVDSIRANGVIVPVVGWRDTTGTVHVRYGQRRTLGAREAGAATIPVYVVDVDQADKAQRIVEQLVENDQRSGIRDSERVDAWRQLELEGLSPTAIAKRTGTKREQVKTGLAVAASETATALVANVGMTLDQAAELIEFQDDPELISNLTDIAFSDPGYFPVAVQQARNERAAAILREQIEEQQAAKGHRILPERPAYDEPIPYRLHQVTNTEGARITNDQAAELAGMAVYVAAYDADRFDLLYYVDDIDAAGLTLRPGESGAPKGPMTDEQKAERKTLIANNKEWDAAETVRREWLTAFVSRKTLPKDAILAVATSLAGARHKVADSLSNGNSIAKAILGLEQTYGPQIEDYLTTHPTRALHVAVAITLGGIEQTTSRDTWRRPQQEWANYLRLIHAWGYPLSPVERIAAMTTDAAQE